MVYFPSALINLKPFNNLKYSSVKLTNIALFCHEPVHNMEKLWYVKGKKEMGNDVQRRSMVDADWRRYVHSRLFDPEATRARPAHFQKRLRTDYLDDSKFKLKRGT